MSVGGGSASGGGESDEIKLGVGRETAKKFLRENPKMMDQIKKKVWEQVRSAGDTEKNVDLETLYVHSRNNKVKAAEGWIQKCIGEILLNIDDQHISEAEHWILKAIEADQRNRMMFHLGKDYALYAGLFKRKGDRLKTKENLGKAIELFKECGADGWVEKYEKVLAQSS